MKNLLNRALALICVVLMMVSLFALPAFAHEGEDHNHAEETTTTTGNDNTALIVWIIVGGVLVVAGVVLGIKYRENIVKALRVYKSEFKKVSWLSWEQTRKSTLVVVVILVVVALAAILFGIGLPDFIQKVITSSSACSGAKEVSSCTLRVNAS